MTSPSGFTEAFTRACQGSEEDLRKLIDEYGTHIQRVVRRQLDERLRPKFDSLDFVQMVWASFFADPARLSEFETPERLVRYLAGMARHKVIDEQRRRLRTNRYNVGRERPQAEGKPTSAPSPEGTPSQFAIARERLRLLETAESPRDREIVRLRMQGCSFRQIAERIGLHERTVRKVIDRVLKDQEGPEENKSTHRDACP